MDEIIKKLKKIGLNIKKARGTLGFFSVVKRTDPGMESKWDVFISAPWSSKNEEKELVFIIENLKRGLKDDIEIVAQIILLTKDRTPDRKFIEAVQKEIASDISEKDETPLIENLKFEIENKQQLFMKKIYVLYLTH